ncbi:hypothetical protein GCM10010306_104310 [Streptomyces umbrinus]|uniref:tetratricopeptide repeat protein n=1 Tax=Streptomyces umbrinus TaxID=67370 RepID=UPI001678E453|nr:hypothetical protein [Streptomyces umbrinus]GHB92291.1 hypothetical protein GCM10010306_104310 [Streptomyces umbrinus]
MAAVGSAAVVLACVVGLLSLAPGSPADRPDALPPPRSVDQVEAARAAVRDRPRDAFAWSQLGQTETEQARTTLDAAQLDRAEKAFGRSLALRPKDNYDAVAGSGTLANARHEFTAARQFGRRATEMAPGRPAGYAALADAHIQLGEYPAATAAAQRLLDLAPTVPAYTRPAYDLETHGRSAEAANSPSLQKSYTCSESPRTASCDVTLGYGPGSTSDPIGHLRMNATGCRATSVPGTGDQLSAGWASARASPKSRPASSTQRIRAGEKS